MTKLERIRLAKDKKDFAKLLKVSTVFLTNTLYLTPIEDQYEEFQIPKRSGGFRTIHAPTAELKDLQSRLSNLLLDCIDDINKEKEIISTLSHGFVRKRSIITNARLHVRQKNVLNIDLEDFFGSFNFGRVRGFFLKNNNFKLDKNIATIIAKIACLNDTLPQGSPCSPVITNLITHPLDIRLAQLAKKSSSVYTRYADDITFSTRERNFSEKIVSIENKKVTLSKKLKEEIRRSGFNINHKKTRLQFADSRQDVTGLIVNKKINIKREYWRETRAMCHSLFKTGEFTINENGNLRKGTIDELYGKLNFIDSIDRYNHYNCKESLDHRYSLKDRGIDTHREKLNGRESTFSDFLYYKNFIANNKPTLLFEGKTDNIYIKYALKSKSNTSNELKPTKNDNDQLELPVSLFDYTKRTRYLLDLYGGGNYLKFFSQRYKKSLKYYNVKTPQNPVILVLDNDNGPNGLIGWLSSQKIIFPKIEEDNKNNSIRNSDFIHIVSNLYLILTPRDNGNDSMMENLFDDKALSYKIDGREFEPSNEYDSTTKYGKNTFSLKVVKDKHKEINFDGFIPLLLRIAKVIKYHKKFVNS